MAFDGDVLDGVEVPRWHPSDRDELNFGDELGPLLVRAIRAGSSPVDPERGVKKRRLVTIGSVIHLAQRGDTVWGSGVNGKVRQRLAYPLDVRAVRGPYTRAVLLGYGVDVPKVYGDPALLLPTLVPELTDVPQHGEVVVVPNLNDRDRYAGDGFLDPLGPPLDVVRRIAGASFVIASSLHGLVVADAFGVPSRPLLSASEHPFKYIDYYAGTGRRGVEFARTPEEARDLGPVALPEFDRDALLDAFPHDLWSHSEGRRPRHVPPRQAAMAAIAEIARGHEYAETAAEARTLARALNLIGDQDEFALGILDRVQERGSTPRAARELYWFLRKGGVQQDMDARVVAAVQQAAQPPMHARREDVLWRLVAANEVLLARAIAREHADLEEGVARARALGVLEQTDDAPRAEPHASRDVGTARRRATR